MTKVKDLTPAAAQLLLDTAELLKEHRTTGSYCRDSNGMPQHPARAYGTCYCLLGGVYHTASALRLFKPDTLRLTSEELKECPEAAQVVSAMHAYIAENYPQTDYDMDLSQCTCSGEVWSTKASTIINFNDRELGKDGDPMPEDRVDKMLAAMVAEISTPTVVDFLKHWLKWAEEGGQGGMFDDTRGLCWSYNYGDWPLVSLANPNALRKLLYVDFGNAEYPFGGAEVYGLEKLEESMHRNEKRLAWVRSKVKESEECDNSTAS